MSRVTHISGEYPIYCRGPKGVGLFDCVSGPTTKAPLTTTTSVRFDRLVSFLLTTSIDLLPARYTLISTMILPSSVLQLIQEHPSIALVQDNARSLAQPLSASSKSSSTSSSVHKSLPKPLPVPLAMDRWESTAECTVSPPKSIQRPISNEHTPRFKLPFPTKTDRE